MILFCIPVSICIWKTNGRHILQRQQLRCYFPSQVWINNILHARQDVLLCRFLLKWFDFIFGHWNFSHQWTFGNEGCQQYLLFVSVWILVAQLLFIHSINFCLGLTVHQCIPKDHRGGFHVANVVLAGFNMYNEFEFGVFRKKNTVEFLLTRRLFIYQQLSRNIKDEWNNYHAIVNFESIEMTNSAFILCFESGGLWSVNTRFTQDCKGIFTNEFV